MNCPSCGTQNNDNVNFCAKCGFNFKSYQNANANCQQPYNQPPYGQQQDNAYQNNPPYPDYNGTYQSGVYNNQGYMPDVNNYMVLSIIAIFFNLILGIIAVVYANKSKTCYNMGDYYGAVSNAKTAKILSIVGIIVGTVFIFLQLLLPLLLHAHLYSTAFLIH